MNDSVVDIAIGAANRVTLCGDNVKYALLGLRDLLGELLLVALFQHPFGLRGLVPELLYLADLRAVLEAGIAADLLGLQIDLGLQVADFLVELGVLEGRGLLRWGCRFYARCKHVGSRFLFHCLVSFLGFASPRPARTAQAGPTRSRSWPRRC